SLHANASRRSGHHQAGVVLSALPSARATQVRRLPRETPTRAPLTPSWWDAATATAPPPRGNDYRDVPQWSGPGPGSFTVGFLFRNTRNRHVGDGRLRAVAFVVVPTGCAIVGVAARVGALRGGSHPGGRGSGTGWCADDEPLATEGLDQTDAHHDQHQTQRESGHDR